MPAALLQVSVVQRLRRGAPPRRLWTAPDLCQNSAEFDRISQKYDRLANGEPGQEAAILSRLGGQLVGIISFGN